MEKEIIINGVTLTNAQALTVRVAVSSFHTDMKENGLGNDETGKAIANLYIKRAHEVEQLLIEG